MELEPISRPTSPEDFFFRENMIRFSFFSKLHLFSACHSARSPLAFHGKLREVEGFLSLTRGRLCEQHKQR
jgi:hypothetical protein